MYYYYKKIYLYIIYIIKVKNPEIYRPVYKYEGKAWNRIERPVMLIVKNNSAYNISFLNLEILLKNIFF